MGIDLTGNLGAGAAAMDGDAGKKPDRRTRYTLNAIRDAFFELLRTKGFDKLTVTDICKLADINRGTFYLHYVDKYQLLDAIIDEALDANPMLDGSPASMCQRAPINDDYMLLYQDPAIFPIVTQRVIERARPEMVPAIMERTGLCEEDACAIFIFCAHGNLAVNHMLDWKHNARFKRTQRLIDAFVAGGYDAVDIEKE